MAWASCRPLQLTHLRFLLLQGQPQIPQVAVGQVCNSVEYMRVQLWQEAGLVHLFYDEQRCSSSSIG